MVLQHRGPSSPSPALLLKLCSLWLLLLCPFVLSEYSIDDANLFKIRFLPRDAKETKER